MNPVFELLNAIGLVAFAVVGTLKGSDANLDLFGAVVLGSITALGGGIVRDALVARVPAALTSTTDVAVVLVGIALGGWLARSRYDSLSTHPALVGADAVGLASLTGVGGGSISDLLLARIPVVLREDFYATPAVIGGALFPLAIGGGVPADVAALGVAGVVFSIRMLALRFDWRLPKL